MHAPQNVRTRPPRLLRAACDAVQAFAEVLQEENPDLFKWLTGQEPPSEAMRDNAAFMVPQSPPIHPHAQPSRAPAALLEAGRFCVARLLTLNGGGLLGHHWRHPRYTPDDLQCHSEGASLRIQLQVLVLVYGLHDHLTSLLFLCAFL